MTDEKISYHQVIADEDVLLRKRRAKIMGEDFAAALDDNRFGIALSGGGIRSATINLGILRTLRKFGVLKQADYLSTVSGGGYTGAYIQATTREAEAGQHLFADEHIDYMRERGEYLFPGTGWEKLWNQLNLVVAFLVSFLMSLISPAILAGFFVGGYYFFKTNELVLLSFTDAIGNYWATITPYIYFIFLGLFLLHYIFNVAQVYKLDNSSYFNRIETGLLLIFLATFSVPLVQSVQSFKAPNGEQLLMLLVGAFILLVLGLFTNPNATSFHRFYRKQLADAFLHFAPNQRNVLLSQLTQVDEQAPRFYQAPYPLINTCLNLQASKDPNFQGAKASDYFLLSPLYCGAKLVGYVPTKDTIGYRQMTLPAAVTISAAAVNPGLGAYSNKLLSILLTIFNLRLGFWTWNPLRVKNALAAHLVANVFLLRITGQDRHRQKDGQHQRRRTHRESGRHGAAAPQVQAHHLR
ncbi:MAG: hypothetical protein AAGJ82_08620 [Bacteroidota bacterium]